MLVRSYLLDRELNNIFHVMLHSLNITSISDRGLRKAAQKTSFVTNINNLNVEALTRLYEYMQNIESGKTKDHPFILIRTAKESQDEIGGSDTKTWREICYATKVRLYEKLKDQYYSANLKKNEKIRLLPQEYNCYKTLFSHHTGRWKFTHFGSTGTMNKFVTEFEKVEDEQFRTKPSNL